MCSEDESKQYIYVHIELTLRARSHNLTGEQFCTYTGPHNK